MPYGINKKSWSKLKPEEKSKIITAYERFTRKSTSKPFSDNEKKQTVKDFYKKINNQQ